MQRRAWRAPATLRKSNVVFRRTSRKRILPSVGTRPRERLRSCSSSLAENLSKQLSTGFPEYRKVSEGPTRVGAYDGYEFRFEGMSRDTAKGDVNIWGRVVFLPPPSGGNTGVTLLMLTTSLAPELKSIDDVGVKGELPMVLESFRFGK